MKNKQLISSQRYQIQSLLQVGTPKKRIAEVIETSVSSVYREINRNKGKRGYTAASAQEYCDIRKERYRGNRKFTQAMEKDVREKITIDQWSPQQICGEARLKGLSMVSHERIYQFIRKDKANGGRLWMHTRHKLKHRKRPVTGKRITIKNKVSIELRPAIVDNRERCGDWEIDTIIGKDGKGAILTLTERLTGFLLMEKLPMGKQAEPLAKVAVRILYAYKQTVHTITSDNGSEFAAHEFIAKKLKADFYFAHPYSSWERGLNENTNGLIRQYIIKGSDFDLYSDNFIRLVQNKINRRPREKLFFQSPSKIFYASLLLFVAVRT
ncbi:IS30 family transposase [Bacteroidia bacterium]|nr:IS30 family transposase [Bacteroidia bacterium]